MGEEYFGRVVGIQPFGAFVELLPGKDGLLHISRVAQGRVEKVEDVLSVGDEVHVKVIEVDEKGKVSLDRIDKPEAPGASESDGAADKGAHKRRSSGGNGNGGGRDTHGGHGGDDHADRPAKKPARRPGDRGANGPAAGMAGRAPRRHHEGQ